MGTIGTAAFDNEQAVTLLEEIAAHPPEQRAAALEQVFREATEPDRIVAAAAIVAATLIGGRQFDQPAASGARLPAAVPGLGHAALGALVPATGPGSPWARDPDRRDTVAALTQVLTLCGNVTDELDDIWNDAADYGADGEAPDGTPPGIEHLASLLRVHNSVMGGGVGFALEVNEPFRVRRAIDALRYFELPEAAALLDDVLRRDLDGEPADTRPDDELTALLDGDYLDRAFRAKAERVPADFGRSGR
ncbi:DUF4259 domain-containing protein [Actinoplanes flavus]|uniref:DUF4259 domain-containing protein n=1 Tax=Actinoplanes flavus TaxID=2820290 RepID=A0ABS3UWK1_9ACTN|nr:DUF4259 domain-containing protein [Actinoplanes flavus]MBO3742932.1 DUF4259 domain-containing protein [Actinoplanes flavus]